MRDYEGAKPPVPDTATTVGAQNFDEHLRRNDWLNPIAMSRLQSAVLKNKDRVTLNGIEFSITYKQIFHFPASDENRECIKLKRIDGAPAPFGYISMKRIREFKFEE